MKKLVALALLFTFLFNIGGYSVLYWMATNQASKELRARLDKDDFSGNQAITIKIPVSLPYQPDRDYERVDGEFEYQGQYYRLVKQRVLGDTLHVVCILDSKKKELVDDMNRHVRMSSEHTDSNQPLKVASSNPLQEYSGEHALELNSSSDGWSVSIFYSQKIYSLANGSSGAATPPPWC
jgi:hypothetical protein